jgi:hypothetical protein
MAKAPATVTNGPAGQTTTNSPPESTPNEASVPLNEDVTPQVSADLVRMELVQGPWSRQVTLTGNGTPWSQIERFVGPDGEVALQIMHDGSETGTANANQLLRGINLMFNLQKAIAALDQSIQAGARGENSADDRMAGRAEFNKAVRELVGIPPLVMDTVDRASRGAK